MEDKMNRIKFITLIMLMYIALYVIFKLLIVYVQDVYMRNDVYDKEYNIGNILNIKSYTKEEQEKTDYFQNESNSYKIKIKNYLNNFEQGDKDESYEYQIYYNEENKVNAAFMVGQFDTKMSAINSKSEESIFYEYNHFPLYISETLRDSFIKKHNIENDVDLIKYIRERKKIKCTFTTPIVDIKENYFYNFIETSLPNLEKITYLEGDLEGYIYEGNDSKQACIIKDNKLYALTFFKLSYFTDEIIEDILRSLIIEK